MNKRVTKSDTVDKEKVSSRKMVAKIQEEAKEKYLPSLKEKMEETTNFIVKMFAEKGVEQVSNIQIMGVIAKNSLLNIAVGGGTSYSSQEILAGFNLYLDMINKINEYKVFPPTIEGFCNFIGISATTFNNWLSDADKKDAMEYVKSYLTGALATGSLTGELKEISSIYIQKTMGKVEQTTPVVIEHKRETNIDEIRKKIEEIKRNNMVVEANYEEVQNEKD